MNARARNSAHKLVLDSGVKIEVAVQKLAMDFIAVFISGDVKTALNEANRLMVTMSAKSTNVPAIKKFGKWLASVVNMRVHAKDGEFSIRKSGSKKSAPKLIAENLDVVGNWFEFEAEPKTKAQSAYDVEKMTALLVRTSKGEHGNSGVTLECKKMAAFLAGKIADFETVEALDRLKRKAERAAKRTPKVAKIPTIEKRARGTKAVKAAAQAAAATKIADSKRAKATKVQIALANAATAADKKAEVANAN